MACGFHYTTSYLLWRFHGTEFQVPLLLTCILLEDISVYISSQFVHCPCEKEKLNKLTTITMSAPACNTAEHGLTFLSLSLVLL